jgi:ABC-2 type transport system permease protein
MSTMTYARYELVRTFRNARFFIFSLVFPLVMYFLIAAPNKNVHDLGHTTGFGGYFAPLYYMVGLAAWGAMMSVMAGGARIADERSVGWNRQLRLTPLSNRTYFRAKVLTSYVLALISIGLLYLSGAILGVRLPADKWLQMTGLLLVAAIPFAAIGIFMGHILSVDSMGPALGGVTALFAFLGGVWFPITGGGFFKVLAECLPSYWLVQAGRLGLGGGGAVWGAKGWLCVGVWTVVFAFLAMKAYQRDTRRV